MTVFYLALAYKLKKWFLFNECKLWLNTCRARERKLMSSFTHQTCFPERRESSRSPSSCRRCRPRWRAWAGPCPGPGCASCGEGSRGSGRPAGRGGSKAAEVGGRGVARPTLASSWADSRPASGARGIQTDWRENGRQGDWWAGR